MRTLGSWSLCAVAVLLIGCASGSAQPGNTGTAGASSGSAGASIGGSSGAAGSMAGAAGSSSTGGGGSTAGGSGSGTAGAGGIEEIQQALSGTRLKAYWNGSADGAKQFAFKWYDTQLKIDCTFNTAGGIGRCLPTDMASGSPLYSDSTCTTPIAAAVLATQSGPVCQATPPTLASLSFPDATVCGGFATKIYSVGANYTGPVFLKSGTTCPSAMSLLQSGYVFYSLGAVADLSMYQAITLAHD